MATTLTYDTLKADIARYTERSDSASNDASFFEELPRLINLAERKCARELKVQGFINNVAGTMVTGQSVYPKPDRWRETVSINFGSGTDLTTRTPLLPRAYEFCRSYWPDESLTDTPLYYSDYNYNSWLVTPTPAEDYPFEVNYYQLPALLDDENQSNWLTEYAPELLLPAVMIEALRFLKNFDRVQPWQDDYDRAAAMLNGEDLAKILDRSAVRKSA